MILADKIIRQRKKNGWSQEELAAKMNVSRQAVSKWEGAQTVPDLEKILQLSALFGVTTDYLLKDEMEEEEFAEGDSAVPVRRVTLQEANEYLAQRKEASVRIAAATFLCIISPLSLFVLLAASEQPRSVLSENAAGGVGLVIMLLLVAVAVVMFLSCGFKNSEYEFLEKEEFETEYGVHGMVLEQQKLYRNTYRQYNMAGTFLCVVSPIPLFVGAFTENGVFMMFMLCVTLLFVAAGVLLFVIAGVRWESMKKLLREENTTGRRAKNKVKESISSAYWLIATAIYLGWSFLTLDWHISWVLWPIAGVVYAAVMIVCELVIGKEK